MAATVHGFALCHGFPKQFLPLSSTPLNKSQFQEAVARLNNLHSESIAHGPTLIVTNEDHRFLALDQLSEMEGIEATLLLEPEGRNTELFTTRGIHLA